MKKLVLFAVLALSLVGCSTDSDYDPWGHIKVINNSPYNQYQLYIEGIYDRTLDPLQKVDYEIQPGDRTFTLKQITGSPKEGKYASKLVTYDKTINAVPGIYKDFNVITTKSIRLLNENKLHRYQVKFNGGDPIKPICIEPDSYLDIVLDSAYYHIDAKELDCPSNPRIYYDDIHLDSDITLIFK